MNRRHFLRSSAFGMLSIGCAAAPVFLARAGAATANNSSARRRKVLVCVFQRGAMDGLMAVQPFDDPNFLSGRNRLRMRPGTGAEGLIELDERFALHPAFASFLPLWQDKRLAVVHGIGSPDSTRSHFDAQDYMENGTPGKKSASGWLNRASQRLAGLATPFQNIAFTPALPLSLVGSRQALAIDDLRNFRIQTRGSSIGSSMTQQSFEALYTEASQELLRNSGRESFDAVQMLQSSDFEHYQPSMSSHYPQSTLANHFKNVAQLIKADVGLEIAFVESGGWDTHVQQGTTNGQFARVASDFARSISAFWNDIDAYHDDVVLMSMTEFGRTVHENGSGGTDHGRASCMFVLGNNIDGGRVHGTVPVLAQENLADGRDLPVTTDFRSLFSGVLASHLGIRDSGTVFPEWTGQAMNVFR